MARCNQRVYIRALACSTKRNAPTRAQAYFKSTIILFLYNQVFHIKTWINISASCGVGCVGSWLGTRHNSAPPGRLRYQNNCHSHAECVSCRGGGWPAVASKRGLTTRSITPTSLQKLLRSASRSAEGGWDSSSDLAHSSRSAYRAACLRRLGCSRHAHATSGEGPALPPSPGGGGGERGAAGRDAESQTVKQKRSVPVHGSTLHRGAHKEMVTALLKTRTLPGGRWPRLRPP